MRKILVVLMAFVFMNVNGQVEHVIDEFKDNSKYYSSFNSGWGSISTSVDQSTYYSGSEALKISYSFGSNSSDICSSNRNYTTATQDYSFQVTGFSIYTKGGESGDEFTIRLWEDINRNGSFDGLDEVWMGSKSAAGAGTWTMSSFDLNGFTKVTGSGNDSLDLNRIRAWDLALFNTDGVSSISELHVDKLILNSSYTPPTPSNEKLNGSFIQLWNTTGCNCGTWTQQQWDTELQEMSNKCMDKLVVQYGVYHTHSWYTPTSLSGVTTQGDALNKIILAAEKVGIKVYVGLYFDENWNTSNKALSTEYDNLLAKHQTVMDEVWNLFGNSSAFGGWYIPQELNDLEWQGTTEKNLLFNWLKSVSDYAYLKSATHTTMIAPFINLWQPADLIKTWYKDLFSAAPNLNEVYPQDGVGITLKNLEYHVPLYNKAVKEACLEHGRTFGATVESFNQLTGWPIDGGSFSAESAAFNRLHSQIAEAKASGASSVIQFGWSYMQNGASSTATSLNSAYGNHANCLPTSQIELSTEQAFYPQPCQNLLQLGEKQTWVNVYDNTGKLLFKVTQASVVNFSGYADGIYFVTTSSGASQRVVVQR